MPRKPVYIGNTNQAILSGEADLSIWTDEELMRGQRRDRNGKWGGRPPKVVPTAIHNELVRRRLSKAGELLNESVVDAVQLLRKVVVDDDANYADRIKAAVIIMERVMGKTPDRVELTAEVKPWEVALRNGIVRTVSSVLELESTEVV